MARRSFGDPASPSLLFPEAKRFAQSPISNLRSLETRTPKPPPITVTPHPQKSGQHYMADGGVVKANSHWMEKAFANSHGQLRDKLGAKPGQPISKRKLYGAAHSSDSHTQHQAQAAINANPRKQY